MRQYAGNVRWFVAGGRLFLCVVGILIEACKWLFSSEGVQFSHQDRIVSEFSRKECGGSGLRSRDGMRGRDGGWGSNGT